MLLAGIQLVIAQKSDPTLASVRGQLIRAASGKILVGANDGSVVGFDSASQAFEFRYVGTGDGPVVDLCYYSGRPWWTRTKSRIVNTVELKTGKPITYDMEAFGMKGAIKRIGVFFGYILVSGDSESFVIDPGVATVMPLKDVLPANVWQRVQFGTVVSTWYRNKKGRAEGSLVSVVRVAQRDKPDAKTGLKEVAQFNAWSTGFGKNGKETYTNLGGPTAKYVQFDEVEGPRVQFKLGAMDVDLPYAAARLDNVLISSEGIVSIDEDVIHVAPVSEKGWVPEDIVPGIPPRRAQLAAAFGANLWMFRDGKLMNVSLEDGSTDVYVPMGKAPTVVALAADEEGAWMLTDQGVISATTDLPTVAGAMKFLQYEAGAKTTKPKSADAIRLGKAIDRVKAGSVKLTGAGIEPIRQLFKEASLPYKPENFARTKALEKVDELRYGDLVQEGSVTRLYVGNGTSVQWVDGKLMPMPLSAGADTRVLRLLSNTPPVTRPVYNGGYGEYDADPQRFKFGGERGSIKFDPRSPYDKPFDDRTRAMKAEMESWLGVPYRMGGNGRSGIDCSGFVQKVYSTLGIRLPRHSQDMKSYGRSGGDSLRYGDVIVIRKPNRHVMIYVGNGQIFEATPSEVQITRNLGRSYREGWVRRFL